jgi:hypothetical protein
MLKATFASNKETTMKSFKDVYLFLYQITHMNLNQWEVEKADSPGK